MNNPNAATRLMTVADAASRIGVTVRTIRRYLAEGSGPPVVKLSERRLGILESDFNDWIMSRRRVR